MKASRLGEPVGDAVSVPMFSREANSYPYSSFPGTSERARARMLADRGEPLFYANWDNAVFIHYEADLEALQQCVPFPLDLYHGRAFVSIVAFTLRDMRPRIGSRLGRWLVSPIATHNFFNVRTYVRHQGEVAIYFMSEWLSNRLSVLLGPVTFGLPYRYGKLDYAQAPIGRDVRGQVRAREGTFQYQAKICEGLTTCEPDSLSEFLMERYTAFTSAGWRKQFFRVWHEAWPQCSIEIDVTADDLLAATGKWWSSAELVAANYSPGVSVWMGWPHRAKA